jgi:WD40 repeat protein
MAFAPDTTLLALGGRDIKGKGVLILRDLSTGMTKYELKGHTGTVNQVEFVANGKVLAASDATSVRLWDVASGKPISTLLTARYGIDCIAVSPDGKTLAIGREDPDTGKGLISLWSLPAGKERKTFVTQHGRPVSALTFSPDGALLASGGPDSLICLWNPSSGELCRSLPGHTDFVDSVRFTSDGNYLVSGSNDHSMRLWEVTKGKELAAVPAHARMVAALAISPGGKLIASSGATTTKDEMCAGEVKLWDPETLRLTQTFRLPAPSLPVICIAFTSDGKWLAGSGYDGTVRVWEMTAFYKAEEGGNEKGKP